MHLMDLSELLAIFGPGISGAVFGAGWWFWVDAVVCSAVQVPFLHYLPGICVRIMPQKFLVLFDYLFICLLCFVGIFASLSALMFNCVRKEDIDYSPYDEGEWRLISSSLSLSLSFLLLNFVCFC